jgi:hypothetical protein
MKQDIKKSDIVIFGIIWSFIFFAIGFYPLINTEYMRLWAIYIGVLFVLISVVRPLALKKFYGVWVKIGEFIGSIISKVIMFILYFALFTPVSLILKILGKDLLSKKIDKNKSTYWIDRTSQPQSMKNQF